MCKSSKIHLLILHFPLVMDKSGKRLFLLMNMSSLVSDCCIASRRKGNNIAGVSKLYRLVHHCMKISIQHFSTTEFQYSNLNNVVGKSYIQNTKSSKNFTILHNGKTSIFIFLLHISRGVNYTMCICPCTHPSSLSFSSLIRENLLGNRQRPLQKTKTNQDVES